MPILKTLSLHNTGFETTHAQLDEIVIIASDVGNLRITGTYGVFKDAAAQAAGARAVRDVNPSVEIVFAEMAPEIKQALKTIRDALDAKVVQSGEELGGGSVV